jgi:cell division septal protein FtsQ
VGRLALVQSRPVRGEFSPPWRRIALGAVVGVAALALLYVGARETPVFAVREIEVTGGTQAVRRAVESVARPVEGTSLVSLDGSRLVDELEALPTVRSVTYDRAFPSTLRIFVRAERPLAVLRVGDERWVLSERGRVIRSYVGDPEEGYPAFRLPPRPNLRPGAFVTDAEATTILAALASLPARFPARIEKVNLDDGQLTMQLGAPWGLPRLQLGEAVDLRAKLAVAALLIRSLSPDDRSHVTYLDVSVPERSVVGTNPQVGG